MRAVRQRVVPLMLAASAVIFVASSVTFLVTQNAGFLVGLVSAVLVALCGVAIMLRRLSRTLDADRTTLTRRLGSLAAAADARGLAAQRRSDESAKAAAALHVEVASELASLQRAVDDVAAAHASLPALPQWSQKQWDDIANRIRRGKMALDESTRRLVARDVAALLSLYALVEVRGEPLGMTDYSATPETLLALVALVGTLDDDAVIVEAGSGLSTVWLALAIEHSGKRIRLVALEHDLGYAQLTRDALARQRITVDVEVREAPLEAIEGVGPWFSPSAWSDIPRVDVLFVDGPPKSTGDRARNPAFPLLRHVLSDGAVIILDDTDRTGERAAIDEWQAVSGRGRLVVERELDRATLLRFSLGG